MPGKYLLLVLIAALLPILPATAQTVRIADNSPYAPTGAHIYPDLQSAVDAAEPGDIIHVMPSLVSYGAVTITKRLAFYGIAFNPEKEMPLNSRLDNAYIQKGEFGEDPSGTVLSGLHISGVTVGSGSGDESLRISDITVEHCQISYMTSHEVTNIIVRQNIITSRISMGVSLTMDGLVANNVIYRGYVSGGRRVQIMNNIFLGSGAGFGSLEDATVANNIFYGATPTSNTSNQPKRSIFRNNISLTAATMPPEGDGTNSGSDNVVANPRFKNLPAPSSLGSSYDFTWDLSLGSDSPALGAGSDGTDIGISGGPTPWAHPLRGTPLPLIQSLNATSTVIEGGTIRVEVRAAAPAN